MLDRLHVRLKRFDHCKRRLRPSYKPDEGMAVRTPSRLRRVSAEDIDRGLDLPRRRDGLPTDIIGREVNVEPQISSIPAWATGDARTVVTNDERKAEMPIENDHMFGRDCCQASKVRIDREQPGEKLLIRATRQRAKERPKILLSRKVAKGHR